MIEYIWGVRDLIVILFGEDRIACKQEIIYKQATSEAIQLGVRTLDDGPREAPVPDP